MLTLLFWLVILGIIGWALTQIPMAQPFRVIVVALLAIIAVVVLFRALAGMDLGLP